MAKRPASPATPPAARVRGTPTAARKAPAKKVAAAQKAKAPASRKPSATAAKPESTRKTASPASRTSRGTASNKAVPAPARTPPRKTTRAAPVHADTIPDTSPSHTEDARAPNTPIRTASQRDRRYQLLLQTACLKAGTAAAFASISAKVPLLGRLAPVLLGSMNDAVTLPSIQKHLVRDVLALYALDLSDAEERGVILLATGANLGAQTLSHQMVQQILGQFGSGYLRLVTTRMLPLASIATDIAAAIATTYTVGKRAQVLCSLPGTGANNLGELLRGLTAIDQRRLFDWSGEALRLALRPFRSVLWSLR